MAIPPDVLALKARFTRARRDYTKLKRACEARTVAWRWASWRMFTDTPYEHERERGSHGRWLIDGRKLPDGAHQYGFDEQGRVVVERQRVVVPGWPERFYEEFYTYGEDVIERARYDYSSDKAPINVSRVSLRDGRVVSRASWARAGCGLERVRWRDGLPASVSTWHKEHDRAAWTQRFEFTHDRAGRLERIDLHYAKRTQVVYRRAKEGESVPELSALVTAQLIAAIPAAVKRAKVKAPAYALLLAYDWENPALCLPPLLAVGLEPERRAFVENHGTRGAVAYLWNPAELSVFDTKALALDDKKLLAACELLLQELARRDKLGTVEKVLLGVARALNGRKWTELRTTKDFIVVPADLETARVQRHLKALGARSAAR